jgi:hypothetical protein
MVDGEGSISGRFGARSTSSAASAVVLVVLLALIPPGIAVSHGPLAPPELELKQVAATLVGTPAADRTIPIAPATAPYSIVGSTADPTPRPVIAGNAFAYPDLYNAAPGGSGSVLLADPGSAGSFRASVNFTQVTTGRDGVVGYPELQYGTKPWCPSAPCAAPPVSSALALPLPLARLPPLKATVAYTSSAPAQGPRTPYDVAFDLWLTQGPNQSSVGRGDIEAMFWLFYNDPSILPGAPAGLPAVVNSGDGAGGSGAWDAYVQHANRSDGPDHWTIVYLVQEAPRPSGSLEVDLGELLAGAERVLLDGFPGAWGPKGAIGVEDPRALYLNDVELGSEFLPAPSPTGGSARYEWGLTEYALHVGPTDGWAGVQTAGASPSGTVAPTPPQILLVLGGLGTLVGAVRWCHLTVRRSSRFARVRAGTHPPAGVRAADRSPTALQLP